jgi:hypothetical protein
MPFFQNHYASPVELHLENNLATDRAGKAVPQATGAEPTFIRPLWPAGFVPLPAGRVKESIAKNVGARPWDRDATDERIIRGAVAGEGKIIDSEAEVGGYPEVAPTRAPFVEQDWDLATMERLPGR